MAVAHGAIMAVDLGSEWLKVSVVKPGRSPFSIVVNEMCARSRPSLRNPALAILQSHPLRCPRAVSLVTNTVVTLSRPL